LKYSLRTIAHFLIKRKKFKVKPHLHSISSVRKFGGKPEDYQKIHDWFDETKSHLADVRHRALRHHSLGIFEAEKLFGILIVNSDGRKVSVRDIGEQHVLEDLGTIPTVQDWLTSLPISDWMGGPRRKPSKKLDAQMNPIID
jgi:hypothetical protein